MGKVNPQRKHDYPEFPVSEWRTGNGIAEMRYDLTNEEFAKHDEHFKNCCSAAGVQATARQASKFRNKKGLAYFVAK